MAFRKLLGKSLYPVLNVNTAATNLRNFHKTVAVCVKQINVEEANNSLTISGQYVASPRENNLIQELKETADNKPTFCPKCTLGLDIKHTDVLILSQYLRSDGCMLPRRITGLCAVQQKRMGKLVAMAQKAGLMPNIVPENSKKDPKRRFQWKRYNTYFDETTIRYKKRVVE